MCGAVILSEVVENSGLSVYNQGSHCMACVCHVASLIDTFLEHEYRHVGLHVALALVRGDSCKKVV